MKKTYLFLLLFFPFAQAFSHYLWIETPEIATLNKPHVIKIKYGEFAYDEIEDTSSIPFFKVKDFELWVITPNGEKKELKSEAKGDLYQAIFTPEITGSYLIYLDNKKMEIVDSSQYNFGIYKPQYHATAKFSVENGTNMALNTNTNGLAISELKNKDNLITLKVTYKNQPLIKHKVVLFFKDGWSKELDTNENGETSFTLPWPTTYTIEVIHIDKIPGQYNQVSYEFIWNCTTHYIHSNTSINSTSL